MILVPKKQKEILDLALMLIEQCRVSVGMRSAYYRLLNMIAETGRYDGSKSLINMLNVHLTRTADHLFSPVELKFSIDYDRPHPAVNLERAKEAAKLLTRTWNRNNTDMTFGRGVFEALKYGAALLKQWVQMEGNRPVLYDKVILPWQFGVYREDENRLDRQEAMCETSMLTLPEVWQRIYHMPNADKLLTQIKAHAARGDASSDPTSFFHQVLSTSQLQTSASSSTQPGGLVQLASDPSYAVMGPTVAAEVVQFHELWVKDEEDYTTIQLIEPDILIAPLYRKANLMIDGSRMHPYSLIQPNEVTNWLWGRSELVDLIEPQNLLSIWSDDAKRLFGLQVDKILGFVGENGMTDELYGQMRAAGYANLGQGGDIKDITPKFPPETIPMIRFIIEIINTLGGFPEIMQGKGEPGVRAGVHANTLLKTGSPTLRDRSLLVERQCAMAADTTLSLMEAKDPDLYWTKADDPIKDVEETKFLLSQLPEDRCVQVDSHSSSPIFADENAQLIFQARKMGTVTDEYVLDTMPFPNKELAKHQLRQKEMAQAEQFKQLLTANPEVADQVLKKQVLGRR